MNFKQLELAITVALLVLIGKVEFARAQFSKTTKTQVRVNCYSISDDKDGDGYADKNASPVLVNVPATKDHYYCPVGYVAYAGDCDDNRNSVHPNKLEIPFNNRDDNCDRFVDETEFVYFKNGYQNKDNSFKVRAKINNEKIKELFDKEEPVYADVYYVKLHESDDDNKIRVKSKQRLDLKNETSGLSGSYLGVTYKLDGLSRATVYRVHMVFYKKRSNGSYASLESNPRLYYYTTTNKEENVTSNARTQMILKGLNEYWEQQKGNVGRNGKEDINGTRYGAGTYSQWCSEFYSWMASGILKDIDGAIQTNTDKLKTYFGSNYTSTGSSYMKSSKTSSYDRNLLNVRRADWVALDTNGDGEMNHSSMLLAVRGDDKIITLEGNISGGIVDVITARDFDQVIGYGHISSRFVK